MQHIAFDVIKGRTLSFPEGSLVAIDRGYNDYQWYQQLTNTGVFFVTRLKTNAKVRVIQRQEVLAGTGVGSDHTIKFTGAQTAKKCPVQLRRIGYRDPETGKPGPPERIDGMTVGVVTIVPGQSPQNGEMHPDGDEILYVVTGTMRFIYDSVNEPMDFVSGEASVVRKCKWQMVDCTERTTIVHITPGPNGEARSK